MASRLCKQSCPNSFKNEITSKQFPYQSYVYSVYCVQTKY